MSDEHTCGGGLVGSELLLAEKEIKRLNAIVGKLPTFRDGPPAVPGFDYGWTGTWDELDSDGSIYRHDPVRWRVSSNGVMGGEKVAADLYSSEEVAKAQPVEYCQNVYSEDRFIPDDHFCEKCADFNADTCNACDKMMDEAAAKADELNNKSEKLIGEYPRPRDAAMPV